MTSRLVDWAEDPMSKSYTSVIWFLILVLLLGACQSNPRVLTLLPATKTPVLTTATSLAPTLIPTSVLPPTTSTSPSPEISVTRALLSYKDLMQGFAFTGPVDESAFAMPDDAAPPAHVLEGRLELFGEKDHGKIDVLKGSFPSELGYLPAFDFAFVQHDMSRFYRLKSVYTCTHRLQPVFLGACDYRTIFLIHISRLSASRATKVATTNLIVQTAINNTSHDFPGRGTDLPPHRRSR